MAKKVKKYKVGVDSETYAISLVESPAIEETLVALEEQKQIKVQMADEEKHMVFSAVLVPDKPIYRRNDDGDEFYIEFTKESIERMSQNFLKEYRQHEVTLDHSDIANEVCVVESWIKTDMYKDKSVALGLNEQLPVGTWFAGMKINNIETWDRIKSGELKGFSVESMISLEDFSKIDDKNNKNMEIDEMSFWAKMKETLKEAFSNAEKEVEDEKELINGEFEENTPTEPTEPIVEPKVEEPTVTPQEVKEEPTEPTVQQNEPQNEPKADEPKDEPKDNHLVELVESLKAEIEALKQMNEGLNEKVKDLGKQPSVNPVNTNAKPSAASAYDQWREQMAQMIGM